MERFVDRPMADSPIEKCGIVIERTLNGYFLSTNVPHLVVYYSPSGYEMGYVGNGPADLALNILEWYVRRMKWEEPSIEALEGTKCTRLAWNAHQRFMQHYLSEKGLTRFVLPYATLHAWCAINMADDPTVD